FENTIAFSERSILEPDFEGFPFPSYDCRQSVLHTAQGESQTRPNHQSSLMCAPGIASSLQVFCIEARLHRAALLDEAVDIEIFDVMSISLGELQCFHDQVPAASTDELFSSVIEIVQMLHDLPSL